VATVLSDFYLPVEFCQLCCFGMVQVQMAQRGQASRVGLLQAQLQAHRTLNYPAQTRPGQLCTGILTALATAAVQPHRARLSRAPAASAPRRQTVAGRTHGPREPAPRCGPPATSRSRRQRLRAHAASSRSAGATCASLLLSPPCCTVARLSGLESLLQPLNRGHGQA